MFKKTAIVLGLTIASGSAFAANGSVSAEAGASAGGVSANTSTQVSATSLFHKLDTNGDGVLSASEAKANPKVAELYDSMDTGASIKTDPKATKDDATQPGGVTLSQFKAGIEAESGGTVGPAVSGGQTYTVMKDGMQKAKSGAADAKTKMHSQMSQAGERMKSAGKKAGRDTMAAGEHVKHSGQAMENKAASGMHSLKNKTESQAGKMRSGVQNTMSEAGKKTGDTLRNDATVEGSAGTSTQTGSTSVETNAQTQTNTMSSGQ